MDRFTLDPESGFVFDRDSEEWLTTAEEVFDAMTDNAQICGGTPSAESDCSVIEMGLCEVEHVMLRPNQLYRFIVMPGCEKCRALDVYSPNVESEVSE